MHRVRLSETVDSRYFVMTLRASAGGGGLSEYFTGPGMKHFTGKGLDSYVLPLPPLADQRRPVARIEAPMRRCPRRGGALNAAPATRRRLPDALLAEGLAPAED